jgi:hypothetical protein
MLDEGSFSVSPIPTTAKPKKSSQPFPFLAEKVIDHVAGACGHPSSS